jgi:hypothetical protein
MGVSTAITEDQTALPTYRVNTSAYCSNLMYRSAMELSQAMQNLPNDYTSQMAGVRVAQYLGGYQELCTHTADTFTCSTYAENRLRERYNVAKSALSNCHNYQCHRLAQEIKDYFSALDRCSTKIGLNFTQMIKITVPTAKGQQEIQHEMMEIQMDIRNIMQSPAAHEIAEDLQRWEHSPEAHELKRELHNFQMTPQGARLAQEIQEALDILSKKVHPIPNGIEINNSDIPQIEKEFHDIEVAAHGLDSTYADERVAAAAQRAFQQKDFQAALRKLDRLEHSDMAHELADDLDDLGEDVHKYAKVTNVPADLKPAVKEIADELD